MHSLSIIHRDVKPANILVPYRDHRPRFRDAKLTDFGLSDTVDRKIVGDESGTESAAGSLTPPSVTQVGIIIGTINYMAPEQARGQMITAAADVHALGVVLFEIIYGRTPFPGGSALETLMKVANEEISMPSRPQLPTPLRRLITRATRFDIKRRPEDASEFVEELQFARQAVADSGALAFFGLARYTDDTPSGARSKAVPILAFAGTALALIAVIMAATGVGGLSRSVLSGIVMVGIGIVAGALMQRWFTIRRSAMDAAAEIILGVEDRKVLSRSLAIQIEDLVIRCERVDQKLLGTGLVLQLQEYREANTPEARQVALMNTMELVERLFGRLLPWYSRYERLMSFGVSLCGVIPGIVQIVRGMI
jgi:hypothetical protein